MSFKTVVTHPINESAHRLLAAIGPVVVNDSGEPWDAEPLRERCSDADAVMVFMTERIDRDFVGACPDLRIIAGALKGYNNIDVAACTDAGVLMTIVPDLLTVPTAELTLGLMISVARNMGAGDRFMRSGSFQGWRPRFYGRSINGSTIAVVGAGAVGQSILGMLTGFDCTRLYTDHSRLSVEKEQALSCRHVSLDEAQAKADFLVLALHLEPDTYHMIDSTFLAGMKPGSFLINPARGSLVDESAVATALASGRLGGYAADTFEMEDWSLQDRPAAIGTGLLGSERTILTPHIGSAVSCVREQIELSAAESIAAVARGDVPETAVNAPARASSVAAGVRT